MEKIPATAMALPMGEMGEKKDPQNYSLAKAQTTQTTKMTKWTSTKTLNENRYFGWI